MNSGNRKSFKRHAPRKRSAVLGKDAVHCDPWHGGDLLEWLQAAGGTRREDWQAQHTAQKLLMLRALDADDAPMYVGVTAAAITDGYLEVETDYVYASTDGDMVYSLKRRGDTGIVPPETVVDIVSGVVTAECSNFYRANSKSKLAIPKPPTTEQFETAMKWTVYALDPQCRVDIAVASKGKTQVN